MQRVRTLNSAAAQLIEWAYVIAYIMAWGVAKAVWHTMPVWLLMLLGAVMLRIFQIAW